MATPSTNDQSIKAQINRSSLIREKYVSISNSGKTRTTSTFISGVMPNGNEYYLKTSSEEEPLLYINHQDKGKRWKHTLENSTITDNEYEAFVKHVEQGEAEKERVKQRASDAENALMKKESLFNEKEFLDGKSFADVIKDMVDSGILEDFINKIDALVGVSDNYAVSWVDGEPLKFDRCSYPYPLTLCKLYVALLMICHHKNLTVQVADEKSFNTGELFIDFGGLKPFINIYNKGMNGHEEAMEIHNTVHVCDKNFNFVFTIIFDKFYRYDKENTPAYFDTAKLLNKHGVLYKDYFDALNFTIEPFNPNKL